jgi:hypothetical protein
MKTVVLKTSARMTRRLPAARMAGAAVAGAGLLLAACGSSGGAASAQSAPGRTPTVTVTVTAPPSSSPKPAASGSMTACPTSFLQTSVGRAGEAAGSSFYPIELTNVSASPCTMYGYPGVSLVTSVRGGPVGAPATRNPARHAVLLTLAPGETASALLQVASAASFPASRCKPVTARWLKVYPPGQYSALYYGFRVTACSAAGRTAHVLSIGPMMAGSTGR